MTFKATLHAFPASLQRFVARLLEWRQTPFPLRSLQKHAYHQVKGIVSAQMTCTAIRLVAACYSKRKRKKLSGTVNFKKPFAVFLIGKRKRDAAIKRDGTISIWTVGGRKRLAFSVPELLSSATSSTPSPLTA
jgi:hypothetical protein